MVFGAGPKVPRLIPADEPEVAKSHYFAPKTRQVSEDYARSMERFAEMERHVDTMQRRVLDYEAKSKVLEHANEVLKEDLDRAVARGDKLAELIITLKAEFGAAGDLMLKSLDRVKNFEIPSADHKAIEKVLSEIEDVMVEDHQRSLKNME